MAVGCELRSHDGVTIERRFGLHFNEPKAFVFNCPHCKRTVKLPPHSGLGNYADEKFKPMPKSAGQSHESWEFACLDCGFVSVMHTEKLTITRIVGRELDNLREQFQDKSMWHLELRTKRYDPIHIYSVSFTSISVSELLNQVQLTLLRRHESVQVIGGFPPDEEKKLVAIDSFPLDN